jgi:hypothetical protein
MGLEALCLATVVIFFALLWGFVVLCDHLQ